MGPYTGIDILLDSHLSFHAIRNGLAPKLGSLVSVIEEEMDYALGREVPSCKGLRSNTKHQLDKMESNFTARLDGLRPEPSSAGHSLCNYNSPFRRTVIVPR